MSVVEAAGVLDVLRGFDPVVVGTFPLGLDRPGSDVDVVCFAPDLDVFLSQAVASFSDLPGFSNHRRTASDEPDAVVVRFLVDDIPVELFAQPIPTSQQRGFRHFTVERRMLQLGGEQLAQRVREARREGDSVEVAFADVLGLVGDPYVAVLELAHESDDQLRDRIRGARG